MDYFIGQIILMASRVIPKDFLPCDGRILPIANNQALFSLIGNTYGGNGTTNFALPNLINKVPMSNSFSGKVMVSGHAMDISIPTTEVKYCICVNGIYPSIE